MVVRRIAATVMAAVVLSTCGGPSDRDLHQALKSVGCAMPESQYQQLPGRVVLSISVMGCRASDHHCGSRLLGSTEATTLVARTAWAALTYRFDALLVTNSGVASVDNNRLDSQTEISRDELEAMLGRRDPELDTVPTTPHFDVGAAAIPWIVIAPLSAVLGLMLFVGLVRDIRRGSISVMWIIR